MGFSQVSLFYKLRVAYYHQQDGHFLCCLVCFHGFTSMTAIRRHLKKMHSLKNLKFIEVSQFVGVQMSGLLPSRTASYPLLPIVPARLCGSGHLSTGKTLNSLKTCLHSQCGSPFTSSCVAQIAGRTKCLLNQAIPENPSIQFFKDYLNSYSENASSVPVETQESTRKSRAVDTLFDVNSYPYSARSVPHLYFWAVHFLRVSWSCESASKCVANVLLNVLLAQKLGLRKN